MKVVSEGADSLFEQYTIKEIQEIEQKIRNDIERKKEDLRQMVGERYRDLIEAADTIGEMKQTSENVARYISSLTAHCKNLQVSCSESSANLKSDSGDSFHNEAYAIVAQVRLLVDVPSKVWSFLEQSQFLPATSLYLLARHTYMNLQLGSSGSYRRILLEKWNSLVGRQWTSISCFRATILQNCWKSLSALNLSPEFAAECLTSIVLLNDSTVEEIFDEFLRKRKGLIAEIFSRSQKGMSTRDQICQLVSLVLSTVHLIHSVFYNGGKENGSLITEQLHEATLTVSIGPVVYLETPLCPAFRYFPQVIKDYRVSLKSEIKPLSTEKIQESSQQFVSDIQKESATYITSQLEYLQSAKAIASVYNSVQKLLTEDEQNVSWETVCNDLLGKHLSIWDQLLKDSFIDRIKLIICNQMTKAMDTCLETVTEFKSNARNKKSSILEVKTAEFTWTESPADMASIQGWIPHQNRKIWESGLLAMKAHGHTPQVQSVCGVLDKNLKLTLQDVEEFSSPQDEQDDIFKHIHMCASELLYRFLKFLQQELNSNDYKPEWFALLGQLCCGITELCPHLQQCFPAPATVSTTSGKRTSNTKELSAWQKEKNALLENRDMAYKSSIYKIVNQQATIFHEEMTSGSVESILKTLLQWSEVEIQEESEGGNKVKSTIYVPLQITTNLQKFLYSICLNINTIFGHSLSRSALNSLTQEILSKALPTYDNSIKTVSSSLHSSLLQTWSLQLLFDVRVLSELLAARDNENVLSLVSSLESHIDPFDLDVFMPHLETHLIHAVYQSSLLLGLTLSPNRLHYERPQQQRSNVLHNLLPVMPVAARFPLLPTTSRFFQHHEAPASSAPIVNVVPAETRAVLESEVQNENRSTPPSSMSSSFYEKMRSSWFGGQ